MRRKVHISLAIGWITLLPITLKSDEIHVPADSPTIQTAIDAASGGDQIIVAPGTYMESINFNGKAITIRSSDGPLMTTIDAKGLNDSVVKCVDGEGLDTVIQGFTITGGTGDPSPVPGSTVGGGMVCINSSPTVADCRFSGNSAHGALGLGGGMYTLGLDSNPLVVNCTFSGNTAERHGGGMHNGLNSPTLSNCTFSNNSAGNSGGGVFLSISSPTITNCIFRQNTADDANGGAVFSGDFSEPHITNCIITGNLATQNGGGIFATVPSNPSISSCVIANNTAFGNGGGIFLAGGDSTTVVNTILWGDAPNELFASAGSPSVTFSDIEDGWPGEGNIDTDPFFVDPDNGDFHISSASLCIDAGDNSDVESGSVDMDSEARIGNGVVDIGADEFHDCNNNSSPDHADIGVGTSDDCNENAIPDECEPCPGDLDCNGVVDAFDLAKLLGSWGPCDGCPADIFDDGDVNAGDLAILLGNWGPCP